MSELEPSIKKIVDPSILGLLVGDKVKLGHKTGVVVYKGMDWKGEYADICTSRTAVNCSDCKRKNRCGPALVEHFSEDDQYSQDLLCHEKG